MNHTTAGSQRRRWLTVDGDLDRMTTWQRLLWTRRAVVPVTVALTETQTALLDAVTVHRSISGAADRWLLQRIAEQMGVDDHDMQVVAYLIGADR
ncbi:hypothetical protein AB0B63_07230 [Micromonospora sp. NPDC049081]|uniref:hypothetical protein n=1 Tax=Micromonospora sp. NPDC049081 TaxID=3155150 RepID=UPI0033D15DE3